MSDTISIEPDEEVNVPVNKKKTNGKKPLKQTTKRKRKVKKRAKVWLDFKELDLEEGETPEDKKAKCNHCEAKFLCHSRLHGTKNLKRHLLRCGAYLAKQSEGQTELMFDHGDENKLMAWKFDQKQNKKALAHMIIVDELPFSFVEREGFRHYSRISQPLFDVPCRGTSTTDCYKLYDEEKIKLLGIIRKNVGRICLTTDSWTSFVGKKSYMALTGHFIDNEWKLKKKVLNFCRLNGHTGVDIGKAVESCVNDWGINAILAISVDNASANDNALDFLRKTFAKKEKCLLSGKWIHMRCAAHVLNLVVQDGIKVIDKSIENIRWNSTYNMLEVAQAYEGAFDRYDLEDVNFGNALQKKHLLVPTSEDWNKARKLCEFLKIFYDVTLKISGTRYVTSHTLIDELSTIRELLRKEMVCGILGEPRGDENLYQIARQMKKKFDKYFGEIKNMNLLPYFAFLLDPRNKDEFLQIVLDDHYGREGAEVVELKKNYIHAEFKALYEDYLRIHAPTSTSPSMLGECSNLDATKTKPHTTNRLRDKMKASSTSTATLSELGKYLDESVEVFDSNVKFDILAWWKVNSPRFPIVSLMARDLLAIPVSTVASESVFSTSGRVLDLFRSSLSDKSIESLICTQDWLRKVKDKLPDPEEDDCETIISDSSEDEGTSTNKNVNGNESFIIED